MKTTVISSFLLSLVLYLVLTWFAAMTTLGSEPAPQYRGLIKPIEPINTPKEEKEKTDLPKHDPERIYYGPDGSLFPTPKLPRD